MTCSVLVCDDEPTSADEWLENISAALPGETYNLLPRPSPESISAAIRMLLSRREALRDKHARPEGSCLFDGVDVLIVDYDLLHIDEANTRHTGEGVARLARAFSTAGVIVVLNQYAEAQFDLSLRGHIESHADLNVDGRLVGHLGLWRCGPWEQFRPWHWPVLVDAVISFRSRAANLASNANLSHPISEALGMFPPDGARLSDTAFGFLAPGAESFDALAQTTFEGFIRANSAAVDTRDADELLTHDPEACARIAACRVAKWLEREVLGPQDVLIDIPHLIQRCPFLLRGDIQDLETWNRAVFGGAEHVSPLVPKEAWFSAENWLSRPALWWRRIEAAEIIREARNKFDFAQAPDFVFVEDASKFVPLSDAVEFRAGFHNAFDRRFVRKFPDIRYAPQRRFAFGD